MLSSISLSPQELTSMRVDELQGHVEELRKAVQERSEEIVRLLLSRDRRQRRLELNFEKMSTALKQTAKDFGMNSDIKFSFHPHDHHYQQWLQSWMVLSSTADGIPKLWRTRVWSEIVCHHGKSIEIESQLINGRCSDDEKLRERIAKSACRYGREGARITRVLLDYACCNGGGYCQEYLDITSAVVKVVGNDEKLAVDVLACLFEDKVPGGYYSDDLPSLSVDMAVLRTLLSFLLPDLACHLDQLRVSSMSSQPAYSSSFSSPFKHLDSCYEPPLMDAFSVQWLPVVLTTVLPRKAARRVLDAVLLEGSEMLLFGCLAVWAVCEIEILNVYTITDFYSKMSELLDKLRLSQLLPSSDFIRVMYTLRQVAVRSGSFIPSVSQLRRKHTCSGFQPHRTISCPAPSQGGTLYTHTRQQPSPNSTGVTLKLTSAPRSPGGHIHLVGSIGVSACAVCPQAGTGGSMFASAYAADVPVEVVQHYRRVEEEEVERRIRLLKHGKRFVLSADNGEHTLP